jgi:exodeoxyribonuclease VII small subunit
MTDGPPLPGDGELDALSFEQLMDALEDITGRLAQGDIGIEMAADLYERAERIHALAAARLAQVQDRVARLSDPGDGPPNA